MVYYKKRYSRRPMYRKRRSSRKPKSQGWGSVASKALSMASKALPIAKFVASVVNAEKKYVELYTTTNVGNSVTITHLTPLAQGTDENTRNGNSVKAHSLMVNGYFSINEATPDPANIRLIVFQDTEHNGTVPNFTDIFDTSVTNNNMLARLNPDNTPRFRILLDKKILLSDFERASLYFKRYFKLSGHVRYDGTTADVIYADRGQYYMAQCSDNDTNKPVSRVQTKFLYYDN